MPQSFVRPRYDAELDRLTVFSSSERRSQTRPEEVWVSQFFGLLVIRDPRGRAAVGFMVDMPKEICAARKLELRNLDLTQLLEALRRYHCRDARAMERLEMAIRMVSSLPEEMRKIDMN